MSVEFHKVSKAVWIKGTRKILFEDIDIRIDPGTRVGVLAQPKMGKTTLLRLICGTESADSGRIERSSKVSWPIPLADFLVTSATVASNIRFIARLYGLKSEPLVRRTAEVGGLTDVLNKILAECARNVRSQLAFALGVSLDRDIYLFDERVAAGKGKEDKAKAAEIVKALCPPAGLFLATSIDKEVEANCDSVFVLDNGRLTHYSDPKEGVAYFKALGAPPEISVGESDQAAEMAESDNMIEFGL